MKLVRRGTEVLSSVVDNKTRLEILRLIAELDNPVGAETLVVKLSERGINITVDAVRYHLRVLDEQGFTSRIGNRGRTLTSEGWSEIQRSLVDTRMRYGLAKHESLAQQVTFDPGSRSGQVVGSLAVFPAGELATVLRCVAGSCRAGICVSDRVALLRGGEKVGGAFIPAGKMGIVMVSTATVDGILLSHGLLFRPIFGGVVEIAAWHPYRFVDVVDYGHSSRDPVEVLIRPGSTRVLSTFERGHGLILADVREMVGVARERARRVLDEIQGHGLGGVLTVGQVGQPILGIPVQQHTFGVAMAAGINPFVASYEAGVAAEFLLNEMMIDYAALRPVEELLSEPERDLLAGVAGSVTAVGARRPPS